MSKPARFRGISASRPSVRRPARERAEARVRARISETDALLSVLDELAGQRRLPEVLDIALRKAEQLCHAESSSIWELDPEARELSFRVVRGMAADGLRDADIRVPLGHGIVGSVAASGVAEAVADVEADPRWQGDLTPGFRPRAILTVPLAVEGRVVGVLQLLNPVGKSAFDDDDLRRMTRFGRLVAHAVENARLSGYLRRQFLEMVTAMAETIEKRDPYTGGHVQRVVAYSLLLGTEMGLDGEALESLRLAATLHDIGKISVPDHILRKPSPLDDGERAVMARHTLDGAELVEAIGGFRDLVPGVRSHHERLDGRGYPDGLRGDEIPQVARIIAVADTFDAMTTSRPYRTALPAETAVLEISAHVGTQFCPDVVAAFTRLIERGEFHLAAGQQRVASLPRL